jgi:alkylation response protein AidB-like acyl-CoA dehydrogenase
VNLRYDADTERFRAELRAWLEANQPSEAEMRTEPSRSSAHLPPWARAWQRRLFDAGLLVPGWPPELGGRNATPIQQLVYAEEIEKGRAQRTYNPAGLLIITPTLRDYGTAGQKQRFVGPALRGELTWCLGMSEPGAGSDLAGLQTRAELRDDHFVVTGQKIWTSGAQHADWCFCFVRTDPGAPKHRGISVLIIDMHAPGVEARPMPELTDPHHEDFNEVFFDGAVVPRENLVGELHQGWALAGGSLAHERGMMWVSQVAGLERSLEALRAAAARPAPGGGRLGDDPLFRSQLAALHVDVQAARFLGYRGFASLQRRRAAPEHSLLKLFASETAQRLALAATEALGSEALDVRTEVAGAWDHGGERRWSLNYLRSFGQTIAGGTSEIQRNILAQRVLGLPRR